MNNLLSKEDLIAAAGIVALCMAAAVGYYLAPPELHRPIIFCALAIFIPTVVTTIGQICLVLRFRLAAELLLQLSCALNTIWLILPGALAATPFLTSGNLLQKTLCDRQKYLQALELNGHILTLVRRRCHADSPTLGYELSNRAFIYICLGSAEEAKDAAEGAAQILSQSHSPTAGAPLNNLAQVYLELGDFDKAMDTFEKALNIKRNLGASDADLALTQANLGYTMLCAGKYAQAERVLRQSMTISDAGTAEVRSAVRNNLGEALRAQGELEEAEQLLFQALRIRQEALSVGHPHMGYSYHNLGKLMMDKGQHERSEEYFKKALTIRSRIPGINERDLKETSAELTKLLAKRDEGNGHDKLLESLQED